MKDDISEEFDIPELKSRREYLRNKITDLNKELKETSEMWNKVDRRVAELEDADRVNHTFIVSLHTYNEIVGVRVGIINLPRKLKPVLDMVGKNGNQYVTISTDFHNFNDEEAIQKHARYLSDEHDAPRIIDFRKKQKER